MDIGVFPCDVRLTLASYPRSPRKFRALTPPAQPGTAYVTLEAAHGFTVGRVLRRVLDHASDVRVGETARGLNADLLLLGRRLVLGRHVEDTVRIDVERHLDLRHAARSGWDARQLELADRAVVPRQFALTL